MIRKLFTLALLLFAPPALAQTPSQTFTSYVNSVIIPNNSQSVNAFAVNRAFNLISPIFASAGINPDGTFSFPASGMPAFGGDITCPKGNPLACVVNRTTNPTNNDSGIATNAAIQANINCHSFLRYPGANPNGNTFNDSAWTAAVADIGTNGGCLYFPDGYYRFSAGISYSASVINSNLKLIGDGAGTSVLQFATGGISYNVTNGTQTISLQDLGIQTEQVGAANGLTLTSSGCLTGALQPSYIRNVTFRGNSLAAYWANGINVVGVSYVNYEGDNFLSSGNNGNGVTISGNTAACGTTAGYSIWHNFDKAAFYGLNAAWNVNGYTQGIVSHKHNIINTNIGLYVAPNALGNLAQIDISDGDIETNGSAIVVNTNYPDLFIHDNVLLTNTATPVIDIEGSQIQATIRGNIITCPNTATGLKLVKNFYTTVLGNYFYGCATGINILSAVTNTTIADNQFYNNTAPITNAAPAGSGVIIHDNLGVNPVGASTATYPAASGANYTAGASPETDYLFNGTVTAVKLGGPSGPTICNATPCTVVLGPGEIMNTTYSAAPSMTKSIH